MIDITRRGPRATRTPSDNRSLAQQNGSEINGNSAGLQLRISRWQSIGALLTELVGGMGNAP